MTWSDQLFTKMSLISPEDQQETSTWESFATPKLRIRCGQVMKVKRVCKVGDSVRDIQEGRSLKLKNS